MKKPACLPACLMSIFVTFWTAGDAVAQELPARAFLTPEQVAEFQGWIRSLPAPPPRYLAPLPLAVSWGRYAGPSALRNQGRCGNCATFATVGVLEVQYAINCCDSDPSNDDAWYASGATPCPCPAADPLTGNHDLHLSVQLVGERRRRECRMPTPCTESAGAPAISATKRCSASAGSIPTMPAPSDG